MWFDTSSVLLTSGSAVGGTPLNAFDNALRDAGVSDFNLIKVSSIIPPGVPIRRLIRRSSPVKGEGLMVPTIYVELNSNEVGAELAVAVGAGLPPAAQHAAGVVFVAATHGRAEDAENHVEEMVGEGMRAKGLSRHRVEIESAAAVVAEPCTAVIACAIFCDDHIAATVAHAII